MIAPQGLNRPERPTATYFEISDSRHGGSSAVGVNAVASTTPVDSALNMSLRSIGTGEAPQAPMIGANAAPGVRIFMPLRSAIERTGLSREMTVACGTEYMKTFFTSL